MAVRVAAELDRWVGRPVNLTLLGIMGLAVLLRCASALYQGDVVEPLPGIQDQISYDTLARSVLSGHGFSFPIDWWPATRAGEPTAHWSFLYTLYLTGVYTLVGPHPLAARLVQAVLAGLLYPLLAWRLGRKLFGTPAGIAAALLTTLYGYFIYYGAALMTETFYILAILWAFDLATSMAQRRSRVGLRSWLLLGLALGVAVLLRQLLLLFVPFLFAWLAWVVAFRPWSGLREASARLRPVVVRGLASALVIAILIAPWTIRNYQAFGRFTLLNTNAGYAFFWGNHPLHGTNFVSIFPAEVYYLMIPRELLPLDEAALESALMQRGIGFVQADPGRYALLSISRIKDYFEFWPSPDSGPVSNVARVLSFGVYFPLMLYGLALVALRRNTLIRTQQGPAVILLVLFGLVYTLIHLLSWTLVRYRLPLDAVLMPVAAVAVLDILAQLQVAMGRASRTPLGKMQAKELRTRPWS